MGEEGGRGGGELGGGGCECRWERRRVRGSVGGRGKELECRWERRRVEEDGSVGGRGGWRRVGVEVGKEEDNGGEHCCHMQTETCIAPCTIRFSHCRGLKTRL